MTAYTDREKIEVRTLGRRGRLGQLRECDERRCLELNRKSPEEYRKYNRLGRSDADATINPWGAAQ